MIPPRRHPRSAAPGRAPLAESSGTPAVSPNDFACFAVVTPGLEPFALAEARAIGLPAELATGGGGIEWRGSLETVLRANLGLRIASRVVVRLAQFEATSFAQLEKEARRIAWHRVIPPGVAVRFRVTCKKSRLYHSDAVAQRVADAIVRALPGTRAEDASVSAAADEEGHAGDDAQLIVVRMFHDTCTVSADASGALLHRRGYRLATAKAPLRETLAAGLLAASGWDGTSALVDPLCGSGTIPIEAAMMGGGIAPGTARSFAMERWPGVSRALSLTVRSVVASQARPRGAGSILGSDRDAGAVESAAANAERAGVADALVLTVRAISALALPEGAPGWIVANPPYGVRVGDADRVRDLWAQFGNVVRERGRGWHLALLSPDPALDRQLRIAVRVVAQTSNGGIPVRVVVGDVA